MAVAMVRLAGRKFDEVDLEVLGQERIISRPEPPPRPRVLGLARMAHRRVVDDHLVTAHSRSGKLRGAEVPQPVLLRCDPSHKYASRAAHVVASRGLFRKGCPSLG